MGWEGFLGGFGGFFFRWFFACALGASLALSPSLLLSFFCCSLVGSIFVGLVGDIGTSYACNLVLSFFCCSSTVSIFRMFFLFDIGLPYACILVLSSAALWLLRFLFACLSCAFRSPARSCLSASWGGPGVSGSARGRDLFVFLGVVFGSAILEVWGAFLGPKVVPNR